MLFCAHLAGRISVVLATTLVSVLGGIGPRGVEASPIPARVTYGTSGVIDSAGVSGAPAVRFVAERGATDSSAPFALGSFVVEAPGDGSVTRYNQTPILISYWTEAVDGAATATKDEVATRMAIRGWLSGEVGGQNPAALSVLFDQGLQPADPQFYQPRPLPPFPAGSSVKLGDGISSPGVFSLNGGQSILTLNASGAPTPLEARVDLAPNVPEPASGLIFLAVSGAFVAARRLRRM